MTLLPPQFYQRATQKVATDLIGKLIQHKINGYTFLARITEVEAYLGISDRACHTFGGRRTERTDAMYAYGGHTYVYLIYGLHHCLNLVTRDENHPEAVLIRAAEPLSGFKTTDPRLLAGPGKLCSGLQITKKQNRLATFKKNSPLVILDDGLKIKRSQIVACPRVGVDYAKEAKDWPLRFYINDHKSISKIFKS